MVTKKHALYDIHTNTLKLQTPKTYGETVCKCDILNNRIFPIDKQAYTCIELPSISPCHVEHT